jgi:uncharacterized membrane protein
VGLTSGVLLLGEREQDRKPEHPRSGGFAAVAQQLDPADATALRALMERERERAEPRVSRAPERRREIEATMSRPDYDPALVQAAVRRARAEEAALRQELDP